MNESIKAGANIHAGDGGYGEGTQEGYDAFVKVRNKSLAQGRIRDLAEQADEYAEQTVHYYQGQFDGLTWEGKIKQTRDLKFAELIVRECAGILETEIELVKGYKSTACNDFDVRWHEGKIEHFAKLIEKNKKHFGVEL